MGGLVLGLALVGCQSGSSIVSAPAARERPSTGDAIDGGVKTPPNPTPTKPPPRDDDDDDDAPVDEPKVKIDYPKLSLRGAGLTNCKEQMGTTTELETTIDDTALRIKRVDVHVDCYQSSGFSGFFGVGTCDQAQLDERVRQQSVGTTVFTRITSDERAKLIKGDAKIPEYSIVAKKVRTPHNETYNFDPPLPVFPWPSPNAAYKDLDDGPQTFTSHVTGVKSLDVSVTITKTRDEGHVVGLQYVLTINGNSNNRGLYDQFPLPRQATYLIDTKNRDVRKMVSQDWFTDENCDNEGTVDMTYKLCRKTTKSDSQDFPCD